jgi:isopenicillin N synthase-like dioxygenase
MRLNYYARAGETMNIHEHTDAGLFTVLWANDVRGLEYEDPSTGEFIRLDQLPEDSLTLTINVGDMFQVGIELARPRRALRTPRLSHSFIRSLTHQVLTNGRVRAPKHRVICDPDLYTGFEFPRYSIALFLNPSEHAVVSPALNTDERGTELPPLYRDVPWTEFRRRRFAGDLADEGRDEVQIKDYQLSP